MRVARAARLFFLTRPIKFSICGVVVTFPVVDAKTLYYHCVTEIACLPTVASVDVFHSITEWLLLCMQFQRCIQSASLRPGTHSFFFWMQRILNEGSNWVRRRKKKSNVYANYKLQEKTASHDAQICFMKTVFINLLTLQ